MEMLSDAEKRERLKALRDRSGVSFLECRRALEACSYDIERATLLLKREIKDSMRRFGGILDG